jgi:hypothetical protein
MEKKRKKKEKVLEQMRKKNSVVKSPNHCEFKRGNNNNIDNIEIKT